MVCVCVRVCVWGVGATLACCVLMWITSFFQALWLLNGPPRIIFSPPLRVGPKINLDWSIIAIMLSKTILFPHYISMHYISIHALYIQFIIRCHARTSDQVLRPPLWDAARRGSIPYFTLFFILFLFLRVLLCASLYRRIPLYQVPWYLSSNWMYFLPHYII